MPDINRNSDHKDRANGSKGDLHRRTKGSVEKYYKAQIWKKLGTKFNKT